MFNRLRRAVAGLTPEKLTPEKLALIVGPPSFLAILGDGAECTSLQRQLPVGS